MPEPLEGRTLFSNIVWTDRGGSGGSGTDSDNFQLIYGSNAELARSIVDQAISYWEQVIVDFNWGDGGGTTQYDLSLTAASLGPNLRGETSGTDDVNDIPYSSDIVLDDDGAGNGWFFDPTPGANEDFTNVIDRDGANAPAGTAAAGGPDFLRTALHEIGHAVGFDESADWFEADDLLIGDYMFAAGTDQVDLTSNLYVFIPPGASAPTATFTDVGGAHMYEGPPDPNSAYPNAPSNSNDLINAGRTVGDGQRQLISDEDAAILSQAYGYTVKMPSTIAGLNFLTSFNPANGTLTVNGDPQGNGDDSVVISRSGGSIGVQVNTNQMFFPAAALISMNLNLGAGNDSVTVNASGGSPIPVAGINYAAGDDDDSLYVFGTPTPGAYTVNTNQVLLKGGAINCSSVAHMFVVADSASSFNTMSVLGTASDLDDLHVIGSGGDDIIRVDGNAGGTDLVVDALAGDDTLHMGFGGGTIDQVKGDVVIDAGEGEDTLTIYDHQSDNPHVYLVGPGASADGIFQRDLDLDVDIDGAEAVAFTAGADDDTVRIAGNPGDASLDVDGGLGTDLVFVDGLPGTGGSVKTVRHHLGIRGGLTGNDLLVVDDTGATTHSDLYVTDENVYSTTSGSFFAAGGGIEYGQFEQLTVVLGSGDDNVAVRGTDSATTTVIDTRDGHDHVAVGSATGVVYDVKSDLYVNGGGGVDDVVLDDSADSTADAVTVTAETVGAAAGDTFFGPGGKLTYLDLELLTVNLGTGADTVNVQSTEPGTDVVVNAGDGADAVSLDSNGAAAGGSVSGIASMVTVNGQDGGAQLTLENSDGITGGDIVTVTPLTVGAHPGDRFFLPGGGVAYADLTAMTINTCADNDLVFVRATASNTPTVVNTGGGDDTLKVSSAGPAQGGTANNVVSPVTFDGGIGANSVVVDDSADPTPGVVTVTASGVTGCFGIGGELNYLNVSSLVLSLGSGGNAVNVRSTHSATATTLNTGAASDSIAVDSNGDADGGTVDGIASLLTLNGQGGINTLTLQDSSDSTADVLAVNAVSIGAAAGDSFFGSGGSLAYSSIDSATIRLPSAASGDRVNFTPSAATAFNVIGGNPSSGSDGDIVNMNTADIAGRKFTYLGRNAGRWDFDGRRSLLFSEVEIVSSGS